MCNVISSGAPRMWFQDQTLVSLADWPNMLPLSSLHSLHHSGNPGSTLACHTCCGGFIKPPCLRVATAPKLNKSQPVNGSYSLAISSAIISLWGQDWSQAVRRLLPWRSPTLAFSAVLASPPVVVRTTAKERMVQQVAWRCILGCHAVAWGPEETGSSLTLCVCNGRSCDRWRCQSIHLLRCGAVHLPWHRWIGLCFFLYLPCVIHLQCESMEESALWAAGR